MHPSRQIPRPDLLRSQTSRGPYGPGSYQQAAGQTYPDHVARDQRSHLAYFPPSLPNLTRQHHSYYDERGPLPPPPMHARLPSRDDGYDYGSRPSIASTASSGSSGMYPQHYHAPHHPHQHHLQHHQGPYAAASNASMHAPRMPGGPPMMAPSGSSQQPTYRGHVKTTKDAILLLSACDLSDEAGSRRHGGVMPPRRVTRRLLDSERAELICSGSVFVWDEKEAGMRRWTDGKCWSASRVSGCFLTYRELEARKKPSSSITGGPTSNLYKQEGLIKQSFSMTTTSGRKLHAISYYTKRDVREGLLRRVSEDPRFVGEGGGEWGLMVDEHEYPDPISRAGELPDASGNAQQAGSQSPRSIGGRVDATDAGSSLAGDRDAADETGAVSPRSQAQSHRRGASPLSAQRSPQNGLMTARKDSGAGSADQRRQRMSYPQDATPLHEARGLLPIRPIPVQSFVSDQAHKPAGRPYQDASGTFDTGAHLYDDRATHAYLRQSAASWNQGNLKRSYADYAIADEQEAAAAAAKAQQPRLQRMRSSSMTSGAAEDAFASVRTLARAGSDEEGVSKMRSTHVWSPAPNSAARGAREQDSAVGALLSLRSSASDDFGKMPALDSMMNPTPSTTTPGSTDSSSNESASKPSLSRSDRAALDRFSVRI